MSSIKGRKVLLRYCSQYPKIFALTENNEKQNAIKPVNCSNTYLTTVKYVVKIQQLIKMDTNTPIAEN